MVRAISGRIELINDVFSNLEKYVDDVNGVVFDLGVSSMQLDEANRGFSFLKEGPLDMRMSQTGPTAADLVNTASEKTLSDILYFFGEERASRRIAKAITARRKQEFFETTTDLAKLIESVLRDQNQGSHTLQHVVFKLYVLQLTRNMKSFSMVYFQQKRYFVRWLLGCSNISLYRGSDSKALYSSSYWEAVFNK